jgi:hypothetical protein
MKYKHEWCMQYERFYFVFVLCCEIVQWKLCNIALLFKEKKVTLFFDMYFFSTYILILIKGNDLCVECFKYFT